MGNIKWIKLSTNMFEDEKIRLIEKMPDADTILIIWVKLLSQAGKTNASGYIYLSENIPYTDEMLATIFNRPVSTVRLALKTFEQFGMISIDSDHFITIENWEKHQNVEGMERVRLQNRERKRKQRERDKKKSQTKKVTSRDSHATEEELELEVDIDKDSTTTTDAIVYYQNNIGLIRPQISEEILDWINDFGDQMVIESLKRSLDRNKPSWGYAKSILKSWYEKGIRTLEQAKAEEIEFQNQQAAKYGNYQKRSNEVIPDWFKEQEQEQNKQPNQSEKTQDEIEKVREVEQLLKDFKKGEAL